MPKRSFSTLAIGARQLVVHQRGGVGDVVDRHDLERRLALHRRAHHLTTDAAEAVDADAQRHACHLMRLGTSRKAGDDYRTPPTRSSPVAFARGAASRERL